MAYKKTPEITRLIHDNLWIVVSFAFSRPVLDRIIDQQFHGEWKYLNKTIRENAEVRADRALLEMATQLRVLDDAEGLNSFYEQTKAPPLGYVTKADDTEEDLFFRDMTNKLIHGEHFFWALGDDDPMVIVSPRPQDEGRWKLASVNVVALMQLAGGLIH